MFAQLDPFMQKHDKKSPCAVEVDGQGEERNRGKKRNRKSGKKETGNGGEKYLLCFVYPQKYEIYSKVHLEGSMTCLNLTMR